MIILRLKGALLSKKKNYFKKFLQIINAINKFFLN